MAPPPRHVSDPRLLRDQPPSRNPVLSRNLVLSREQVRRVDAVAIDRYGLPGVVLMENAGRNTAELLVSLGIAGRVTICCGHGNNGGDGFVIARHLEIAGIDVAVSLFADPTRLSGDAAVNYGVLERAKTPLRVLSGELDHEELTAVLTGSTWIVDALLGTGSTGLPRPPYDAVVKAINTAGNTGTKILAVDLPSGLDADAGRPFLDDAGRYGPCVKADATATFVARKTGFDNPASREFTGEVAVIDIGVPPAVVDEACEV
jgi:NAD(P)H-hydrate epimerase